MLSAVIMFEFYFKSMTFEFLFIFEVLLTRWDWI